MTRANGGQGNVRALHRIRVALVGRDPHFVKVAGFLLERHGFVLASTRRPGDALELVDRHRANVVVIDASDSLEAAARAAAAVDALHPGVAVIVVADRVDRLPTSSLDVLPKWDVARLAGEIERAYNGKTQVLRGAG